MRFGSGGPRVSRWGGRVAALVCFPVRPAPPRSVRRFVMFFVCPPGCGRGRDGGRSRTLAAAFYFPVEFYFARLALRQELTLDKVPVLVEHEAPLRW